MTFDTLVNLNHKLGDENPQDDFGVIQSMTKEESLAYIDAEGTITTEEILALADQLR